MRDSYKYGIFNLSMAILLYCFFLLLMRYLFTGPMRVPSDMNLSLSEMECALEEDVGLQTICRMGFDFGYDLVRESKQNTFPTFAQLYPGCEAVYSNATETSSCLAGETGGANAGLMYNHVETQVAATRWSEAALAAVFPWLISLVMYIGSEKIPKALAWCRTRTCHPTASASGVMSVNDGVSDDETGEKRGLLTGCHTARK